MKRLPLVLIVPAWLVALGISFPIIGATQPPISEATLVIYNQIDKHSQMYYKLEHDIGLSIDRILSSGTTSNAQDLAYYQLDHVSNSLSSMNREFTALNNEYLLSNMVTDKRSINVARNLVENQFKYMTHQASESAKYIEKVIPRAQDPETSRLLLEARDLFRSSVEFLDHIKTGSLP